MLDVETRIDAITHKKSVSLKTENGGCALSLPAALDMTLSCDSAALVKTPALSFVCASYYTTCVASVAFMAFMAELVINSAR